MVGGGGGREIPFQDIPGYTKKIKPNSDTSLSLSFSLSLFKQSKDILYPQWKGAFNPVIHFTQSQFPEPSTHPHWLNH